MNAKSMVRRKIADDEKIFARSFSMQKQKLLSFGAFIGCFIMTVDLYSTVLKPYLGPLPIYLDHHVESMKPIVYNFSNIRADVYEIKGDVRIHGVSSTIFIASSHDHHNLNCREIKPYPRKFDSAAMKGVRAFNIKTEAAVKIPHCSRNLDTPAILFSAGGFAENYFHAFTDVLLPLFSTSHHFDRNIIFLMTNQQSEWISKYRVILGKLSKHDIYDIDNEDEILCFPRMIIGLKVAPEQLVIDPSESTNVSTRGFVRLLELERESTHDGGRTRSQPRMLIISRAESRRLVNEGEVSGAARGLGFEVVAKQLPANVSTVAKLVNSFDVMVGVHGAGLTNMVFLPRNAVLLQIVPIGLDRFAEVCFENGARSMQLRYLKYKVSLNESSLLGKYPPDSVVYRNPNALGKKRFDDFRTVYLDNQDLNLDLNRFRKTLLRALELLDT